jgi:acetolactate decarboxylase
MNRHSFRAAGLLLVSCAVAACGDAEADPSRQDSSAARADSSSTAIWQLAPAALLGKGEFGGIMSITEVLRHGNMGLAGAQALNGEMALVDGKFYQFLADGQVVQPPDTMRLPFAEVTFWDGGRAIPVSPGLVYNGSATADTIPAIDSALDLDAFYAVRMEGGWDTLVVRTFRQQTQPYPPLDSAVKTQVVDTLVNVRGTMVGFRQPAYAAHMGVANYHMHFVSEDHTKGGHVLGFVARDVQLQVSERAEYTVQMPPTPPAPSP